MKISNLTKLLLLVLTFSVIVWLGGSIFRAIVAYSIFIPATELELKPNQTDEIRMNVVKIYTDTAIYTTVSFGLVFIITFIILLMNIKHLKNYGWLFMSIVLFFLASPIEIYLTFLDIKLMLYVNFTPNLSFNDYAVTEYFINRLKNLNVISPLAYLSFFTAIIFVIFKPLDKTKKIKSETQE